MFTFVCFSGRLVNKAERLGELAAASGASDDAYERKHETVDAAKNGSTFSGYVDGSQRKNQI